MNRNVIYATWREDREPAPGYSRELISVKMKKEDYEATELKHIRENCKTFLDYFECHVEERPKETFLGTRAKSVLDGTEVLGLYEW